MIFGENLLALMVLALGAALAIGNLLALIRPRELTDLDEGDLERPPLARSLVMIGIGLLATIWALASLRAASDDEPLDGEAIAPAAISVVPTDVA